MTHEVVFDSARHPEGEMVGLASGYISLTNIRFVKEEITVQIEAKTGEVKLLNPEGEELSSAKVDVPTYGDEKFSEVKCLVENGQLKLGFPQYGYEDHYPNCDGEHDRWTKYIKDISYLCFTI